jgi:hypothetical protein
MRSGIPGDPDPSLLIRADHGRPGPAGGSPAPTASRTPRASTSSNRPTQPASKNQSAGTHAGTTIRAARQFTPRPAGHPAAPMEGKDPPALATSARRTRVTAADLTSQRLNNGTQIGPLCATMITEEFTPGSRPERRLGAQLFDAEHAGDGPAVVGRPPSSPADHAAPARFVVSTVGALAGPPALRGWRLDSTGGEHLSFSWVFVAYGGAEKTADTQQALTCSCAQGRSACLKARQPAYSGDCGGAGCGPGSPCA